jgi:VCBS repeat-containing protein
VIASYTDGQGTAESVSSAGVGPIANLNNAPTIAGINTGAVTKNIDPDADGLLEVGGVLTITDLDAGESSFQAGTINGAFGSLTIDAAGNWNYSADNTQAVIQQMNTGESISDVLTVTTADGTTHNVVVTINGATAILDQGGDDPGPAPLADPIEPDPEPEPELPPEEILPVEDEPPPREEFTSSDIPSSKPPDITSLQWADPTYFVPTISMLTTDNMLATDDGSPSAVVSIVKYLQRELASQTIERAASNVSALFSSDAMTQTLDHIQQQLGDTLEMDGKRGKLIIGTATGLGASVFAGYVIWAFRGSSLVLGALTAMPMWRCFDPLPVIMGNDKNRRDRDETKSTQQELDQDETTVKELLGEERAVADTESLNGRKD